MSLNSVLIKGLEARFNEIKYECEKIKSIPANVVDDRYKNLYVEVSYFVHYVMTNEELNRIFDDLLLFYNKVKASVEYKRIVTSMESAVRIISNELKAHSNYSNFIGSTTGNWSNPFINPPTINSNNLLIGLTNFSFNAGVEMFSVMDRLIRVLTEMVQRWIAIDTEGFDSILKQIQLLHEDLQKFDELQNYEHDYAGARSAKDLFLIYRAFRRDLRGQRADESILFEYIHKGKAIDKNIEDQILINARKLLFNLQNGLEIRFSMEVTVERFCNYGTLYLVYPIRTKKIEKFFQMKFEEFVFQEGYYPISEATVKNGRIDTLVVNQNNAFLCELKQVDLGKTKLTKKQFEDKIKHATIQSGVYVDRLRTYPNLEKMVFLIIFVNQPIKFFENISRFNKNGIDFIVKVVYISSVAPSKLRWSNNLNIKKLIK